MVALPQQTQIIIGNLAKYLAIPRQPARGAVNLHAQRLHHIRMQNGRRLAITLAGFAGVDFLLQQAERHRKAVQRGGRRRRAAWNIDIHRYNFIGPAPDAVQVVEDASAVAAGP